MYWELELKPQVQPSTEVFPQVQVVVGKEEKKIAIKSLRNIPCPGPINSISRSSTHHPHSTRSSQSGLHLFSSTRLWNGH